MSGQQITVCGEAIVDLVSTDRVHYTAHAGGSPANVAVGLGRLDVPVAFLGRVPNHGLGLVLREHLAANGIDMSGVIDAAEPTSVAIANLDESGKATYDLRVLGTSDWQWQPGELPWSLPEITVAFHTGSLAAALRPGADQIEALMRRERARGKAALSFDPNVRADLLGARSDAVDRIERLVRLAHIVKVSDEDLGWLYPGVDAREIGAAWATLGPDLVVVTLGGDGAIAWRAGERPLSVASRTVTLVDTVGAGDAFMAGLLTGLFHDGLLDGSGQSLRVAATDRVIDALRLAGDVAAMTCERAGADPPRRAELATLS
jgi:fructokinase